ncbi:RNA polymerase sigma factor [Mangrovibacterium diazotrophicum]|uniref:RNA polymerase sigma-70 factor (ECF subfamily) n=1 Tax=Mangrovibacterium diazotrophicum TaxID=1261403 RepID=A0A419W582_9BACT|nr:sigma-70 family RNA polymerase sigma factor [Mangrovibacterium diazotrophicum]RKD90603.1 RNA polymerase sigma-70 factor (ECF subfamily) [Mangrovibacterium diazotrophicum]
MIDDKLTDQFLKLVEENKKLIFKVSRMFCSFEADRSDLFQEIVANLWKAYPRFNGRSKLSTWIYRVALNTAISWFRDYSNQKNHIEYTDWVPGIETGETLDEITELLYAAIGHLGKVDKAIIMLQLEGYSYDDISEIIGLSRTNVATKINRIKQKLKNHLSNN